MRPGRGASSLSGVLIIDKPMGVTSHGVVEAVRRVTGEGRVGHAGTLDPSATGVLVVLVGSAARLGAWLTAHDKEYEALIVFGSQTDTDDADGTVISHSPVPSSVTDPQRASEVVAGLVGEHRQIPPAYSAIKQGGVVAHRAARSGGALELAERVIRIDSATLQGVDPGPPPSWTISLDVSKGTYIRAVARDLGMSMGTHAHLGALRRTRSGAARIDSAVSPDSLVADGIEDMFSDPVALLGLPRLEVDASQVVNGTPILVTAQTPLPADGAHVSMVTNDLLMAVYRRDGDRLVAETVFAGGVKGVRA